MTGGGSVIVGVGDGEDEGDAFCPLAECDNKMIPPINTGVKAIPKQSAMNLMIDNEWN